MPDCVLDASAVLAVLRQESGGETVRPYLRGGIVSAVNVCEMMNRLLQPGRYLEDIVRVVHGLELRIVDFGFEQATIATTLQPLAQQFNLSLGDRACLSLGMLKQCPVMTADKVWGRLDIGVDVRVIR